MPLFGKKKTNKTQGSDLGNKSNILSETTTSVTNQAVARFVTTKIVQSSSHTTTTTKTLEERRSISGNGTLFESSTFPKLEFTRHSLLENHSDNNLRSSFGTRQQIPPRTAFSTRTFGSYPSRSSVSPVAGSLITTTGDGQKRDQNIPRLSLTSSTYPVLSTNKNNILNHPPSAPVAVSTTPSVVPIYNHTAPKRGSLITTTGDGQKRGQNIPRLSLTSSTYSVLSTNINNNLNTPPSAPVAISTTPSVVPIYKHTAPKRGKVLIINNIKFLSGNNEERSGAEKDQKELKKMWKGLLFDVEECQNLKNRQMNEKLKSFSQSSFKEYNMSIVIMMSHGSNRDCKGMAIKGGYTEIFGTDGVGLPIDDVLNYFSREKANAHLQGKPKIFIFQCCRGDLDQSLKTDSRPIKPTIRPHEDMLIAWSTIPGFLSNRDPQNGTWYIQSIIKVFKQHYKNQHLEQLLKLVDSELSTMHPQYKQTSTFENRGFNKDCYLVPIN